MALLSKGCHVLAASMEDLNVMKSNGLSFVLCVLALMGITSVAMAALPIIKYDPVWPDGNNPSHPDQLVNGFCDCQQALMDNTMLSKLPDEFKGLLTFLAPATGDLNGTSYVIKDNANGDTEYGLTGNGMLDCSLELKLIEEALANTSFNVNGLTHDMVLKAYNDNNCQFNHDIGAYWGLLPGLGNGLTQILMAHMIVGDGDATFSDIKEGDYNRVDCTGSAGFIKAVMFLLGEDIVKQPYITFDVKATTLAAPLGSDSSASSTTVTLAAPITLAQNDYIRVGDEYMNVKTAVTNSTTVVVSKRLSTSDEANPARTHVVGEVVRTGYNRMPEYFSQEGDADGDDASNLCEFQQYGAADYVANALDPTKVPDCSNAPVLAFASLSGSGWHYIDTPLTLTAVVSGQTGYVTYQWYKNGVEIEDATTNIYTIAVPTPDDSANYRCKATDSLGSIESSEMNVLFIESGTLPVFSILGGAALAAAVSVIGGIGIRRKLNK
jgi:hypothetical protein